MIMLGIAFLALLVLLLYNPEKIETKTGLATGHTKTERSGTGDQERQGSDQRFQASYC